jgi:hypothetical protein
MAKLIFRAFFVLVLLASGYLAGTFSSPVQAYKKVEYKVTGLPGDNFPQIEAYLNRMGNDGWEVLTISLLPGIVIFKRE